MGKAKLSKSDQKRYALQAEVIKALAHPIRVAIADLLSDGERCVCDIADYVGAERSNVSRHLAVMHKAGVVTMRKRGLQVFYALRTPCVRSFLSCATKTLELDIKERAKLMAS